MTTDEEYERALRAIAKAKENPDLISADSLETLVSIVKERRARPAATPSDFGERSSIGPTGLEAMQAGPLGLPNPDAADENAAQLAAAETAHPGVAKALHLSAVSSSIPIPGETASESNARHVAFDQETFDNSLPTASKRKDVAAPPEFIPSPVGESPLERTRKMLPEHFGGQTQHFLEPGLDQFRRDMAPVLGQKVLTMSEGSDEYKIYADRLWKDIYDQAQAEGRPVVREAYKANKSVEDQLLHGVESGMGALGAGAVGADRALTGGMLGRAAEKVAGGSTANLEALSDANPVASGLGFAAGALSPLSAGNLAASGAGAAARGVGLEGGGILGTLLGGAGKGAIAGGVTAALGAPAGGGAAAAGEGALFGAPLGAVGEGVAGLLGREGAALRRDTPLGLAEKGGARTSTISGVEPGAKAEGLRDAARARQIGPSHKPDVGTMLASDLEQPLVAAARAQRGAAQEGVGKMNAEFRAEHADQLVDADELLGAASQAHEQLSDVGGRVLPAARPAAQKLRTLIGDMVDLEIAPAGTEGAISLEDARRAGLPVDQALKGDSLEAFPEGLMVRVKPRSFNVGEIDQVIAKLQEMEGAGQAAREPIHQYDELKLAAHKLRDKIAGGTEAIPADKTFTIRDEQGRPTELRGYSASQAEQAQAIGRRDKGYELAGLPRGDIPEELDASQSERLVGSVRGYGEAGRQPAKDEALRSLATAAGTREQLDQIAYQRAIDQIQELSRIKNMIRLRGSGAVPSEALSGLGLRLRLDPTFQMLQPQAQGLGGLGALPAREESRLPPQADQPTIDIISRLLNGPPGGL